MVHLRAQRRRQFCVRCNQLMFEYFLSPDGHFGLLNEVGRRDGRGKAVTVCAACGAIYEMLEKADATGQPAVRKLRGA